MELETDIWFRLSEICFFQEQLEELTSLFPQKHSYYRQGMRAISLI